MTFAESTQLSPATRAELARKIKKWAKSLGFQQTGITDVDLSKAEQYLQRWLQNGFHGSMDYMARHGSLRSQPDALLPGTIRVISTRLDYLPEPVEISERILDDPIQAYISRYALGRDYHKLMRKRLQRLADMISKEIGPFGYRAFVDSAPVLEKALAEKAGLGWIGKHSNLINKKAGSWFFLGEIYVDLPLPIDIPATEHCGICSVCIDICPTQAIVGPFQVDARRCISYLTIELKGSIPVEFRSKIGNRIYGCDDCQAVCPWNKFAQTTREPDFQARHGLDTAHLVSLFGWSETTFLSKTEGSAIRRIGYPHWLRNLAIALGNAPKNETVTAALNSRRDDQSELVREHVRWALQQHQRNT